MDPKEIRDTVLLNFDCYPSCSDLSVFVRPQNTGDAHGLAAVLLCNGFNALRDLAVGTGRRAGSDVVAKSLSELGAPYFAVIDKNFARVGFGDHGMTTCKVYWVSITEEDLAGESLGFSEFYGSNVDSLVEHLLSSGDTDRWKLN